MTDVQGVSRSAAHFDPREVKVRKDPGRSWIELNLITRSTTLNVSHRETKEIDSCRRPGAD